MSRHPAAWSEAHADPNLIGAWVENALPRRRRAALIRHLAHCHACREVAAAVALASGTPAPLPLPWTRRPLASPAWAWAASAASLLLVAGLSWAGYARTSVATVARPLVSPALSRVASKVASLPASSAATRAASQPLAPPVLAALRTDAVPSSPAPAAETPVEVAELTPTKSIVSSPSAPAPSTAAPVASQSPASGFLDQPRVTPALQLASWESAGSLSGPPPAPRTIPVSLNGPRLNVASASSDAPTLSDLEHQAAEGHAQRYERNSGALDFAGSGGGDGDSGGVNPILATTSPLVNAAGQVDHHLIAGVQWATSRSTSLLHTISSGRYDAGPPDPGVRIRAFNTIGDQVWAGGLTTEIWHSPDGGKHWEKIDLPAASSPSVAPVQSIAFHDARHVVITAADGRCWTTSDAGLHWSPAAQPH